MNETNYGKINVIVDGVIIVLLLLVLAISVYGVFKPPLVSEKTIEELKKSATLIENYTKELQVTSSLARQQISEDNSLSDEDRYHRDVAYLELLSRYGLDKDNEYNDEDDLPVETNGVNDDNNDDRGMY